MLELHAVLRLSPLLGPIKSEACWAKLPQSLREAGSVLVCEILLC